MDGCRLMRRAPFLFAFLLLLAAAASAQDAITIGIQGAQPGTSTTVPVWIHDRSPNSNLNQTESSAIWIQGFAFKVLYPPELISSVTFTRGGLIASLTPLYETTLEGEGWISYIASFNTANKLVLRTDAPAPGSPVGVLTVTVRGDAPAGAIAALTLEPAAAVLTNAAVTLQETVANGGLTLGNGSITVASLATPQNLVATGVGGTHIDMTWSAVANADHYEIFRRSNGGPFALIGTSAGTSYSDSNSLGNGPAYLYRVRAVNAGGGISGFSNIDVASLILFVNDPIAVGVRTIRALHFTQLQQRINALRVSGGLGQIPADPTINTAGVPVLTQHLANLRTSFHDARTAAGLAPVALTDPTITPGVTVIKAVHIEQLRDGVE
ncbi:MAG TPA: fibronectin type III domain-containing protein [Thermoanaerobaculia bacterium]|nr:fibronectin type III domain-containing protein [Thermoanaerobaculia bacterium]